MALYRKYRPATFAEVVGQRHVTEPLSTALNSRDEQGEPNRINHAYLFSGPRGCGKTSSARILARSLNCEQGPTSTPCGVCASCRALAPGGPGNLDVIELDAASNNGVDQMRELRERAVFQPAESRYRIFIIDEAHMITSQGFNALLKIVEEPPEHLIFVFATTEPERMLSTIRSRTHHYPFRLLTPPDMRSLLESVAGSEGVQIDGDVYPLVIQAGGGSPRDSLSILDQLIAGSGEGGVEYETSAAILGVTDNSILADAVAALAAADRASLFGVVNRVIMSGQDPARFALDLLGRVRDLLVLSAVPDAVESGLVELPETQREQVVAQSREIPPATLTRFSQVLSEGVREFRGVTSPRLLLEVLCARMLLPAAEDSLEALSQRIEALERGLPAPTSLSDAVSNSAPPTPIPESGNDGLSARERWRREKEERKRAQSGKPTSEAPETAAEPQTPEAPVDAEAQRLAAQQAEAERMQEYRRRMLENSRLAEQQQRQEFARQQEQNVLAREGEGAGTATAAESAPPAPSEAPAQQPAPAPQPAPEPEPALTVASIAAQWADVLAAVNGDHATPVQILAAQARPVALSEQELTIGHSTGALASRLNDEVYSNALRAAVKQVTGFDGVVRCVVGVRPRTPRSVQHTESEQASAPEEPSRGQQPAPSNPQQPAPPSDDPISSARARFEESRRRIEEAKRAQQAASGQNSTPPVNSAGPASPPTRPAPTPATQPTRPTRSLRAPQSVGEAFDSGVPLPPEPAPEEMGPPEDYAPESFAPTPPTPATPSSPAPAPAASPSATTAPSEEDEEQYFEAAQVKGDLDHRTLLDVTMEMLEKELGAKKL